MGEGARVDEKLDDEKQDEALAGGVLDADNGVVEAGEGEDAREDLVGDLDDDVGDQEGLPRVDLAGALTDFVERALRDEQGLDLSGLGQLLPKTGGVRNIPAAPES